MLDVNGIPVYTEPIKYLGDDPSRHIMIEVYPTTAIGVGRLTILGSVVDVPDEWKGLYNVKWEKDVFIDQVSKNTQPILFRGQGIDLVRNQRYPLPEIEIFETVTGVVVASGSGGNEFVTSSIFEGGSYDGNASPFARPMHIGDLINKPEVSGFPSIKMYNSGHEIANFEDERVADKIHHFAIINSKNSKKSKKNNNKSNNNKKTKTSKSKKNNRKQYIS